MGFTGTARHEPAVGRCPRREFLSGFVVACRSGLNFRVIVLNCRAAGGRPTAGWEFHWRKIQLRLSAVDLRKAGLIGSGNRRGCCRRCGGSIVLGKVNPPAGGPADTDAFPGLTNPAAMRTWRQVSSVARHFQTQVSRIDSPRRSD